jgi:poly(3-hydroxybutyrate) depolymerase
MTMGPVMFRRILLVGGLALTACGGSSTPSSPDAEVDATPSDAASDGARPDQGGAGRPADAAAHDSKPSDAPYGADAWSLDASGDAAPGAFGGIAGLEELSTIQPSAGCGKDPGQPLGSWQAAPAGANKYMFGYALNTTTPKGSITRRYFVMLPKTYDRDKPYRVIFQAPKCGGVGYEVPAFDAIASSANAPADEHGAGVIQVGLTPDPTAYMAGCFDQQAGAATIEKAFVEALWPAVASAFCIDEHRVFVAGYDSGAWLANQLGHVYGSRLFRALSASGGGLAMGAALQPCLATGLPGSDTTVGGCLPSPGIWWHDAADPVDPFTGTKQAVEAALVANHCTNATFVAGPKVPYATLQHATCVSYSTCPAAFPVVLCTASQQEHKNLLEDPANLMTTWSFFRSF